MKIKNCISHLIFKGRTCIKWPDKKCLFIHEINTSATLRCNLVMPSFKIIQMNPTETWAQPVLKSMNQFLIITLRNMHSFTISHIVSFNLKAFLDISHSMCLWDQPNVDSSIRQQQYYSTPTCLELHEKELCAALGQHHQTRTSQIQTNKQTKLLPYAQ